MWLINTVFVFCGVAVFCFYYDQDPINEHRIQNKNQISILWLIDSLDLYLPSAAGFCLAALFSNGVQVLSVGLWSCASSLFDDVFVMPKTRPLQTAACLLFGAASICFAVLFQYAKNSILSLFFVFNNSLNSPLLGLFMLSALNRHANWIGALIAFALNVAINVWLALGALAFSNLRNQEFNPLNVYANSTVVSSDFYPKDEVLFYLYSISSIWYCVFSLLFTFIVGSLFSWCFTLATTKKCCGDGRVNADLGKFLFKKEYLLFFRG